MSESVPPSALTEADLRTWRALQDRHPALERPFFAPEYYRILEEVGRPVRVAPVGTGNGTAGFFPFILDGRAARPAGGRLSDFQGPIAPPGPTLDLDALLASAGVSVWHFDHLLIHGEAPDRPGIALADSPYADLSGGFEPYLEARRTEGAGWVKQVPRKGRKLGREIGDLRFELDCRDRSVLDRVLAWKAEQRHRTRTIDPLDDPWAQRAVERYFETHEPGFAGILSALWAGDELVAAHFGLRSRHTLHIWFPAYDPAYDSYSPGMVFYLELLRAAADEGLTRIDFGKGPARYKTSLMTGRDFVAEGCIDRRPVGRYVSRAQYSLREWVRRSPLRTAIRAPKRRIQLWVHGLRRRPD